MTWSSGKDSARMTCQQPEVILLDEPTYALDTVHQLKIRDLAEKFIPEYGTTIVMVFHDLNLASMYGDRLLLLKNGKAVKVVIPILFLTESFSGKLRLPDAG